jgi:hypothetical protein
LARRHLLGAILLVAFALRFSYLLPRVLDAGFEWADPDHYLMGAKLLTKNGWDWSFRAVRYEWAGRYFYLPPLYPVFLSLFSVFPNMAAAAQIGQALLGVGAVGLVYAMGALVHSTRAGLLAAAVYAVWFSTVITTWFYQETLYVPLVLLAFVLYLRASSHRAFFLAGVVFGLAALTRSMPLYFLPFLLAVRWRRAPAVLLGFVLAVAPYSAALSAHLGEVTIIENHGGIILLAEDPDSGERAGVDATVAALVRSMAGGPFRFVADLYGSLRSVLHVNGGRLLQNYVVARDATTAVLWKGAAHVFNDGTFVLSLLLAPFGLLLAKRKDASLLSAIWIALNLALVSLGGFAGPRLRAPFEPHLIVFASIAAVEGVRALRPRALACAGAVSVAAAFVALPQIPPSLRAWPDYGIRWQHRPRGWRTLVEGSAGFNMRARRDGVLFEVRVRPTIGTTGGETVVEVWLGRKPAGRVVLAAGESHQFRFRWPRRTIAFVELRASSRESGEPRELLLIARRPR